MTNRLATFLRAIGQRLSVLDDAQEHHTGLGLAHANPEALAASVSNIKKLPVAARNGVAGLERQVLVVTGALLPRLTGVLRARTTPRPRV